ncbi:aminotransferase class III-fold pyridoxal phosphate-dependent enzyme [Bradyrhizobium sp. RT11b]|uniref:aminotransferase class III-fold pyridoxal phosphate-dependent enzyme n=1 Tax=Bradyrhizobium sp. RT11b TaxID=3156332 RepID=UPI0033966E95
MSDTDFLQCRLDATPRGVGVTCNFFAQRALNATLGDAERREYIDFAPGIVGVNTGHRHPSVVQAILGGTYAADPPVVAAVHAVLALVAEERLPARAQQLGNLKYPRLGDIQNEGARK